MWLSTSIEISQISEGIESKNPFNLDFFSSLFNGSNVSATCLGNIDEARCVESSPTESAKVARTWWKLSENTRVFQPLVRKYRL